MDNNIYAPPQADMSLPVTGSASTSDDTFYVVSQRKFTILFLATLGVYQLYWFYRQWSGVRERSRYVGGEYGDIWPVARAIFHVFFVHSLFSAVAHHAESKARPLMWDHKSHATGLVVMLIASNAVNRMADSMLNGVASLLLVLAVCYSERSAQRYINESCGDPKAQSNRRFTWQNYAWIGLGAAVWVGLLLPLFRG